MKLKDVGFATVEPMKPLIGITTGEIVNKAEAWAPVTYGQTATYVNAIAHAGGIPILLPVVDDVELQRGLYDSCDGILFSGGNDIDPGLYNQQLTNSAGTISPRRDNQEVFLMKKALEDNKPLLAICRGMQLLNVVRGGSLYQDINDQLPNAENHEASTHAKDVTHIAHTLRLLAGSRLASLLDTLSIDANSNHHQAVKDLGHDCIAVAWAADNMIEAIELPDKIFVIGVQAHPESLESTTEARWQRLFRAFITAVNDSKHDQVKELAASQL